MSCFETSPIRSQFMWSFDSASTTHSAATSCAAIGSALRAVSIDPTSVCAFVLMICAQRLVVEGSSPKSSRTPSITTSWLRVWSRYFSHSFVRSSFCAHATAGLVDLDAALLGLERLIQQLGQLFLLHRQSSKVRRRGRSGLIV